MQIIIYEPCESSDGNERIEHALHHIIAQNNEILEAVVESPARLAALSDKLKASAAALRAATKAALKP